MKNATPLARTGLTLRSAGPATLALLAAVALTSGCSETPAPASSPGTTASAAPSTGAPDAAPESAPASRPAATPELFGTEFQAAPEHDWSKGSPPPFEGVLRGWLTGVDDNGVAEYRPIRFAQSGGEDGHFDGPEEGDVTRYLAPIAEDVLFLADSGCDGSSQTYDKATNLGTEKCGRQTLIDNVKEAASLAGVEGLYRPALITTENGRITKVVEIFWQGGG
ncbi:hypothetical protein OG884_32415 [Streptosporangium sp. NBC_01755]|uniref:hypothetical protein n=1 Tax=unclassified Streptosporangium TaxID=2632669 RepID=UPI002DD94A44|nr:MULTISPECIES: hypothetical protein [unclassified Streptosporangium]WSA29075.1 hypothetical protein OIE13_15075 [Streptosporangium sp. NBC_01810]WSC99478.1 hypothetical protein OG884_32415 [Streptosporangium sp. NBC_01755]